MDETRNNVVDHYRVLARREPEYYPVRMAELAPGVIAVEDKAGECDALFDIARWQFTRPELWEPTGSASESPILANRRLKVLSGLGRLPQVSTIEDMVAFAKTNLSPCWHDTPQFFEF